MATTGAVGIVGDEDEQICPICCEELDITDLNFLPCPCGYQICMFCWNKIKEVGNGQCPACRRGYDDEPQFKAELTPEEILKEQREKKRRARLRKQSGAGAGGVSVGSAGGVGVGMGVGSGGVGVGGVGLSRSGSAGSTTGVGRGAGARVIQHNLVFVVNLPPAVSREPVIRKPRYFGQYGHILRIVTKRSENSAYITYATEEEAKAAIDAVNGFTLDGRTIKACFGTTTAGSAVPERHAVPLTPIIVPDAPVLPPPRWAASSSTTSPGLSGSPPPPVSAAPPLPASTTTTTQGSATNAGITTTTTTTATTMTSGTGGAAGGGGGTGSSGGNGGGSGRAGVPLLAVVRGGLTAADVLRGATTSVLGPSLRPPEGGVPDAARDGSSALQTADGTRALVSLVDLGFDESILGFGDSVGASLRGVDVEACAERSEMRPSSDGGVLGLTRHPSISSLRPSPTLPPSDPHFLAVFSKLGSTENINLCLPASARSVSGAGAAGGATARGRDAAPKPTLGAARDTSASGSRPPSGASHSSTTASATTSPEEPTRRKGRSRRRGGQRRRRG